MKKSQLALAVATAMSASAHAVDLAANLVSIVGFSSNGSSPSVIGGGTTATWSFNTSTGIVTATGNLERITQISPTFNLFTHNIVDMAIGGGGGAGATSYTCADGNAAPIYGAGYCGNHNYGANTALESTVSYGPGTAFSKTIGGDDVDLGPQQNITAYDGMTTSVSGTTVEVSNAVPNVGGQTFTFDVPDLAPAPAGPTAAVVPDVNTDGVNDAALQRAGSVKVELRDGSTGSSLLQKTVLGDPEVSVGVIGIPDANGNGAGEIGSLSTDGDAIRLRVTDGATKAGISNSYVLVSGHTPVDLATIADISGNGAAEVAVLATRNSDGQILVRPTDSLTGQNAAGLNVGFFYEGGFTAQGLAVIPDSNVSGSDELAVLATDGSGRAVVEIREADGSGTANRIWFLDSGFTPIDIEIGEDADGDNVPDVAVLATRDSDGRIVVERRNAAGAPSTTRLWFFTDNNWPTAVDLVAVGDQNGDNAPEYAVLAVRTDGNPAIEIRNATLGNNAPTREFYLGTGFTALQLVDMGDTNGNGITNLGVLGQRDGDGRVKLEIRDPRGPSNTTSIWFTP